MNYSNIDEYIEQFSGEVKKRLVAIRGTIKENAPKAIEKISWQMPTFWYKENLIHFAAFKNHIGIFPGGELVLLWGDKLKEFKTSKGTIQLQNKEDLPLNLIKEIVLFRLKMIDEKNV